MNFLLRDILSGGKVVISGLNGFEEDEFFLNLLNEQNIWDLALLAVDVRVNCISYAAIM